MSGIARTGIHRSPTAISNAFLRDADSLPIGEDLSIRTDWLFEVVFDYGEHDPDTPTPAENPARKWNIRADPFSNFRSTFDIRTYRLCQRVLMFHHFPKGKNGESGYDGLVHATAFAYDQQDPQSGLIGNRIATKLLSVTLTGYNWDSTGKSYISQINSAAGIHLFGS